MNDPSLILLAGASGNLGGRIARALVRRGARVRAWVRPGIPEIKRNELAGLGISLVEASLSQRSSLQQACEGVGCVVSALQGLREVIVDAQGMLLDAAASAGVGRFIPSDYSIDVTQLCEGENRNFDLRREFHERLAHTQLGWTAIYTGTFAEVLGCNVWLFNPADRTVGYWEDPDWKLDFTTIDDASSYAAAVALDADAPTTLRFASFQHSPRDLADAARRVFGVPFHLLRLGSREELAARNRALRHADPQGEREIYPVWQQGQYMQSMFCARHPALDNHRYPAIVPTPLDTVLSRLRGAIP